MLKIEKNRSRCLSTLTLSLKSLRVKTQVNNKGCTVKLKMINQYRMIFGDFSVN